jgi:hypothetical protein
MSEPKSSPQQPNDLETPNEELTKITDVLGFQTPEPLLEDDDPQPEPTTPYARWQADPSQKNLAEVTKSLRPTIDSVIASMGDAGNPHVRSRANVVAAKAIKSYDPTQGASLATYVSGQLRQLSRDVRKSNNVLSIPEGVQLDGYALYRAEQQFMEDHDREPTVQELADKSHLSVKRIKQIRQKLRATMTDGAATGEDGSALAAGEETDHSTEAMDYVYNDSDVTDQKLLEYTTGYGGETPLSNAEIMRKLKLTPVQLTRRKARLSMRIMNIIHDLER